MPVLTAYSVLHVTFYFFQCPKVNIQTISLDGWITKNPTAWCVVNSAYSSLRIDLGIDIPNKTLWTLVINVA